MTEAAALLVVEDLSRYYGSGRNRWFGNNSQVLRAVDGVSFSVNASETIGIVGESGCGKSTLLRCLVAVDEITSGVVTFEGRDVSKMSPSERQRYRRLVQLVFQDPTASLNPRKRVEDIISEPMEIHFGRSGDRKRVGELLELVGIDPNRRKAYPSQFSGGQRQRVAIARAIAAEPVIVLFDEPVAGLDVSIQAQMLNLLVDIRSETGVASVFVSHDLSVVRYIAHTVLVMYLGKVVEVGPAHAIFSDPAHPYTLALLSAVPKGLLSDEAQIDRILLEGEPPNPINPPAACRFHPRCWKAAEDCRVVSPALQHARFPPHRVACHYPEGQNSRTHEA